MDNKPVKLADQIASGRLGGFTGEDVRGALEMARADIHAVERDLSTLGKESRHEVLRGDDRTRFFEGMTQPEFDLLHKIAMSQGDAGLAALERIMHEAQEHYKSKKATAPEAEVE